jgi:hypothetical protein
VGNGLAGSLSASPCRQRKPHQLFSQASEIRLSLHRKVSLQFQQNRFRRLADAVNDDGALIRMQQGVAKLAVLAAASIKAVRQEVEPVAKLDGLHHSGAIHQGSQKFVGMFGCDSKWGQGFFREITQIVGQDHLSLSVHRRSQDVTVVFIRQGQAGNQLLVPSIRQSAVV